MPSRIKGATLIANMSMLRDALGMDRLQAVLSATPPETQQLLRRTLVAVEWVPVDTWAPLLHVIHERVFRRDDNLFRKLLRTVCKREFSGTYRAFLNHATPSLLATKTETIWNAYFDAGSLRVDDAPTDDAQPRCRLQLRDLETQFPVYAVTVQAYIEQILSMIGAERLTVTRMGERLVGGKLSCDYVIGISQSQPGL